MRDHLAQPIGAAVRVGAVGLGAPDVPADSRVDVRGNTLLNNTFALFVEAAFPVQNTALKGDVHHRLENNVIAQSCEADLLLSFTRHTAALGLNVRPYLRNSVYELDLGGNLPWAVSGTPTQEALVTRWSLIAR